MRRNASSPFGTSFIDLLVGALAMVALLWAVDAANSGARGPGEAPESAAMLIVEQYGYAHIKGLEIGQHEQWSCTLEVLGTLSARGTSRRLANTRCAPEPGATTVLTEHPDGVSVARGAAKPLKVRWRLDVPPNATFRETLMVSVEGLTDRDVEGAVRIAPCCSRTEPHYVRTMAVSGAGHAERTRLWHEAGRVRSLLKEEPLRKRWIDGWRASVRDGTFDPALVVFDAGGGQCDDLQSIRPAPALAFVFEPEGDVRITEPPDPGASPAIEALRTEYPRLLSQYAGVP